MEPRYTETQWPRGRSVAFLWALVVLNALLTLTEHDKKWWLLALLVYLAVMASLRVMHISVDDRALKLRLYGIWAATVPIDKIEDLQEFESAKLRFSPYNPRRLKRGVDFRWAGRPRRMRVGTERPQELIRAIEAAQADRA